VQELRDALSFIPSEDRDTWVRMGMAVKSELGDSGFDLWNAWSMASDRYRASDARAVWRSIRAVGGITVASLYKEARQNGWTGVESIPSPEAQDRARRASAERRRVEIAQLRHRHAEAAQRAQKMLSECYQGRHQYLADKGFPDAVGLVWEKSEEDHRLVIPMRIRGTLSSVQLIDAKGGKKFLPGGRASGAEFVIGDTGRHVLVEGYATGLSVLAGLRKLGLISCRIHVCFSAQNMIKIARALPGGTVIADHDLSGTGQASAAKIGWPFWLSDVPGEDANDAHRRLGLFRFSQSLRKVMV